VIERDPTRVAVDAERHFHVDGRWDARLWSVHRAASCDAGILLLNGHYGEVPSGMSRSYTHLEATALATCSRGLVVLQSSDSARIPGNHARKQRNLQQMIEEATVGGLALRIACEGARRTRELGAKIDQALTEILARQPASTQLRSALACAAASLHGRLWRITSANRQSYRGAYRCLRAAENTARPYPNLDHPADFLTSTCHRLALVASRLGAVPDASPAARRLRALIAGRWSLPRQHPLRHLYRPPPPMSDWCDDLQALADWVQGADGRLLQLREAAGILGSRSQRVERLHGIAPRLVRDLISIVDTDLRYVETSARRNGTWNRLKLIADTLADLIDEIGPDPLLIAKQDLRRQRYRRTWTSTDLHKNDGA